MDPTDDAALQRQAQEMAEKALAALPQEVRALKLGAVREGILRRLRESAAKGPVAAPAAAPTAAAGGPPPVAPPPPPAQRRQAPAAPKRRPAGAAEPVSGVEVCGDEAWFADAELRRKLRQAVAAAHAGQKILVGPPAEEIRRICPAEDHVLGAGAVLRLGGSRHGGYGEADINYAYRQLSRALHPDKNPGVPEAPNAFKRLGEAAEELRKGLAESRSTLQAVSKAVGASVMPEMLERPQGTLLAEASRLLAAVVGVTGEGTVSGAARSRALANFRSSSLSCNTTGTELLTEWYESDELLELFAGTSGTSLRVAYDCAPKRFRAQFLCALNRASAAEAKRNDGCVRGTWQAVVAQFPEICVWQELLHKLRSRVAAAPDAGAAEGGEGPPEARAPGEGGAAGEALSGWGRRWRSIISDILPRGADEAAPATDREVRRLAVALWRDIVEWADKEGDAKRHLELFTADHSASGAAVNSDAKQAVWAFIPVTDLFLVVGEDLVGCTVEGLFTAKGPPEVRRTYEGSRRARGLAPKRGLASQTPEEHKAKKAKLNRSPTRIVLLTNLVGAGEVDEDLQEETEEEAKKYGPLKKCIIKEIQGVPDSEAVRIFLEYPQPEHAAKCYSDMNGRYFGGRVVKARFYDEDRYAKGDLERRATTRVLLLTNLVSVEEVDEELEGETVEEASKYGEVKRCVIKKMADVPEDEVVHVFIEYERQEDATKAFGDINGRSFGGRQVKIRFYEGQLP